MADDMGILVQNTTMRLPRRRQYSDFYLPHGKSQGRQPLLEPDALEERERREVDALSYQWECIKVLDPYDQEFGHYGMAGWWRIPSEQAIDRETGTFVYDTEMCTTYGVAFVVERGRWYTPNEWEQLHPDSELARVTLNPSF